MVSVFISLGQNVVIEGHQNIKRLINKGVKAAYEEASFRKSVVSDPLIRDNTKTNIPAVIHFDVTGGDKIKISVIPKGFGSENKSRIVMLNPTAKEKDIIDFCVETVKIAGPDACPPYILGVGIGGTFDEVALYAKRSLLRPISKNNPKKHIARLEKMILKEINTMVSGSWGWVEKPQF